MDPVYSPPSTASSGNTPAAASVGSTEQVPPSPSSILKAQLAQSLIAPALPTIHGSPSDEVAPDPFHPLFHDAMRSAEDRQRTVSDTSSTSQFIAARNVSQARASQAIVDDIAQYVNSHHYSTLTPPRLDIEELVARSQTFENHKTPATLPRERSLSSKADTSANWRAKVSSGHSAVVNTSSGVQAIPTNQVPRKVSENFATPEGTIMTIDSLFERFGHGTVVSATIFSSGQG